MLQGTVWVEGLTGDIWCDSVVPAWFTSACSPSHGPADMLGCNGDLCPFPALLRIHLKPRQLYYTPRLPQGWDWLLGDPSPLTLMDFHSKYICGRRPSQKVQEMHRASSACTVQKWHWEGPTSSPASQPDNSSFITLRSLAGRDLHC